MNSECNSLWMTKNYKCISHIYEEIKQFPLLIAALRSQE